MSSERAVPQTQFQETSAPAAPKKAVVRNEPPPKRAAGNAPGSRRSPPQETVVRTPGDRLWRMEIAFMLIAICTLFVPVAIFQALHDRPLRLWPKAITPNTLLAVVTDILKPILLFPLAKCFIELKWLFSGPNRTRTMYHLSSFNTVSQGPWGAILLLYRRFGVLASLGAGIALLSLAFNPFIQQTIKIAPCTEHTAVGSAKIPRTNDYTPDSIHTGAGTTKDSIIAAAVYRGALNPPKNATAAIDFDCSSGNCTFPNPDGFAYRSLGICSQVDDLTDKISAVVANLTAVTNITLGPINYTLPSGLFVNEAQLMTTKTANIYTNVDLQRAA